MERRWRGDGEGRERGGRGEGEGRERGGNILNHCRRRSHCCL